MLCWWSHRAAGLKAGHGHDPSHQTQQRGQALSGSRREKERKEQRGERNCSPGQRERPRKQFPRDGGRECVRYVSVPCYRGRISQRRNKKGCPS